MNTDKTDKKDKKEERHGSREAGSRETFVARSRRASLPGAGRQKSARHACRAPAKPPRSAPTLGRTGTRAKPSRDQFRELRNYISARCATPTDLPLRAGGTMVAI